MYQSKRNINYNLGEIYFLGNDLHCMLLCCKESEAASSSVLGFIYFYSTENVDKLVNPAGLSRTYHISAVSQLVLIII